MMPSSTASAAPSSAFHFQRTVFKARPVTEGPAAMVGAYELLEEIARGGMGVVYRARDARNGRVVALKMVRGDLGWAAEEAVCRFRREAEAGAILRHPHIMPIFETGSYEQRPYLVMDFASGGRIDRQLPRFLAAPRQAVVAIEKIARALHYVHEQGILHRDIKPANILLDDQGEPRLTDFGLAKLPVTDVDLTRLGEPLGTPGYMAPEQAAGRHEQVGAATEVWALGVLLFELLTGMKPFLGENEVQLREAIVAATPLRPRALHPQLDGALECIVLKCLRKEPAQRYPTAQALADDLQRWLHGRPLAAVEVSRSKGAVQRLRLATALMVVSLSAGLLAWFTSNRQATEQAPAATAPAFQQLARGQSMELLPEGTLPPWHRWAAGNTSQLRLRPLTLEGFAPLLLELLPRSPQGAYRLEAEVSSQSIELGEAGIYFAHDLARGPNFEDHLFISLTHARSPHANHLTLAARRYGKPSAEDRAIQHHEWLIHWPLQADAPQSSWQKLAVEVSAEQVVAFWQGTRIGAVPKSKVAAAFRRLANFQPSRSPIMQESVDGPGGVYVRGGRGSFRSAIISAHE
jgi:hypothetical protein